MMKAARTALTTMAVVLGAAARLGVHTPAEARDVPAASDTYLDGLEGSWTMAGAVAGQPVRYRASGERVLKGSFLRLRMVDVAQPPHYQADVYLSYDPKAGDYVVHWLDEFGAAGARVVGTGHRDGERLVVDFPYADGAFRDTFTRDPAAGTWTLLLESQGKDGRWSTFATYTLVRPARSVH